MRIFQKNTSSGLEASMSVYASKLGRQTRMSLPTGYSWDDLLALDANGEDWELWTDDEIEDLLSPFWYTTKLCGAQKCWIARRHHNWLRNIDDRRLFMMMQSLKFKDLKKAQEMRAKRLMATRIEARPQAFGREWNRLTRLATED